MPLLHQIWSAVEERQHCLAAQQCQSERSTLLLQQAATAGVMMLQSHKVDICTVEEEAGVGYSDSAECLHTSLAQAIILSGSVQCDTPQSGSKPCSRA